MMNKIALILGFTACLAVASCSGTAPKLRDNTPPAEKLVWPLPPDKPRVSLEKIISSSDDIGSGKKAGTRIIGAIFGKDTPKRLVMPYSICAAADGRIFVTDTGLAALHVFDKQKHRHTIINTVDKKDLEVPIGVAVGNNRIYISDAVHGAIYMLNNKYKSTGAFGQGIFSRPTALFYDNTRDRLLVCDTAAHKVFICGPEGGVLMEIGGRGEGDGMFNFPNSICAGPGGKIYVLDSFNFRVQIFTPDGRFISRFGTQGDGPGSFACPKGIAVDRGGHIYVADSIFGNFQVFDESGQLLLVVGHRGTGPGEFYLPSGIFIDSADNIYMADTYNHRIQILKYLSED